MATVNTRSERNLFRRQRFAEKRQRRLIHLLGTMRLLTAINVLLLSVSILLDGPRLLPRIKNDDNDMAIRKTPYYCKKNPHFPTYRKETFS